MSDPQRYGSAERFLQLAVETINDIANHVIAEKNLGTVNVGRDIPHLFRLHGYVDEAVEARWVRMIGFRNILVHDYLEVDRTIVYGVLSNDLEDLRNLAKVLSRFL